MNFERLVLMTAMVGAYAAAELTGPNVCTTVQVYMDKITITSYNITKIVNPFLCIRNFGLMCFRNDTTVDPVYTEKMIEKYTPVKECCGGYVVTADGNHCSPVCDPPCNHGTCIMPNICRCDKYFDGQLCDTSIPCPQGFYGPGCTQMCQCLNNGRCDSINGTCQCLPGHTGEFCEKRCPPGYFGYDCKNKCECPNDARCNSENGECQCPPGRIGPDCKNSCPNGTYGINCGLNCDCQNGSTCRPTDGMCLCKSGFFGPTCSEVCPKNHYGETCLHECVCDTATETCDPIRGCVCDTNIPNNTCTKSLQFGYEDMNWIFDVSVLLAFLTMTILCTGILMGYYCYYRHQLQKLSQENKMFLERYNYVRNTDSSFRSISTIELRDNHVRKVSSNLSNPISYTNEAFVMDYDRARQFGYDGSEHLYLEIGELTAVRTENLYDRLDFLRPTGSWKPHYQCTIAPHDQVSSNSGSILNPE